MNYEASDEIAAIAAQLLPDHFPELKELVDNESLRIAYMFRDEAPKVGEGRVAAGMCVHVDDRNWRLHGFDFIIQIGRDVWETVPDANWRHALVHHELCHIGLKRDKNNDLAYDESTGRVKAGCRHHDIEEFEATIEAFGAWHGSLRQFLASFGAESVEE